MLHLSKNNNSACNSINNIDDMWSAIRTKGVKG